MKDQDQELIDGAMIPEHIAIIMDGNGRWAKQRGLPRTDGHIRGQESLRATVHAAGELGVKVLTVYAFSTENWERPKEEVDALMALLVQALHKETEELIIRGVRLLAIGDLCRLPEHVLVALNETMSRTAQCDKLTLVIALSYSSKDEITRAVVKIGKAIESGDNFCLSRITDELIERNLDTAGLPDLDLLIRTGGEYRISNFLLWQAAYAELYFSPCLWPDFDKNELVRAINEYNGRERRFGRTSEQLLITDN